VWLARERKWAFDSEGFCVSQQETEDAGRSGPLAGIRVVDLTRVMTGPYCTMMLGDLGADVIKVEVPGKGDDTRAWGPPFLEGEAAYYLSINRNKRSIALDLKSEAGKAVLWRLIEGADVLVENFSPGTIGRLGFGWDAVHARNPRLVFASISGFGQTGPGANRTAYDLIVQGMGGIMSVTGEPGGMPTRYGIPIGDISAGMFAAYAIAAALFARSHSGEGQYIDVSMFGGQVAMLTYQAAIWFATGRVPEASGNAHPLIAPYDTFATKDGHVNIAVGNDGLWIRFCQAMGLDDMARDDRLLTNTGRVSHRAEVYAAIEPVIQSMTTAEVAAMLDAVSVPCGPINRVDAVFAEPQVAHMKLRREVEHPTLGPISQTGFPYAFSSAELGIHRHPPMLGEQTEEILREAGFTDAEITHILESGAAQTP
jgi:crotonobetainyl-CoA:carnitine CoA-transferase CaiB-like acyl-CoA transferase